MTTDTCRFDATQLRIRLWMTAAAPPEIPIGPNEKRLMNIWLPGRVAEGGLVPDSLFPILEPDASTLPEDADVCLGSLPLSEFSTPWMSRAHGHCRFTSCGCLRRSSVQAMGRTGCEYCVRFCNRQS